MTGAATWWYRRERPIAHAHYGEPAPRSAAVCGDRPLWYEPDGIRWSPDNPANPRRRCGRCTRILNGPAAVQDAGPNPERTTP